MGEHPEGHPDDNEALPGEDELRILEGFLEGGRLKEMLEHHATMHEMAQKAALSNMMEEKSLLGIFQQILAVQHMAVYHNIVMQIGLAKRLDHIGELLEAAVTDGGDEWGPREQNP